MNGKFTVYTHLTECQDCYKCLRQCPVKAITVSGGHASIDPLRCIACGKCVSVCPARAKSIRNDTARAMRFIDEGREVYVALAPSWRAEFRGVESEQIITALKQLGFAGVGEVALGAQDVSAWTAALIGGKKRLWLSSACPVCVEYVRHYLPDFAAMITPVVSPAVSMADLLRKNFGIDIRVVFIGPCIAKKNEAESSGGLMDLALTFQELRELLSKNEIEPLDILAQPGSVFVPELADEGRLYPVEGGMIETIKPLLPDNDLKMFCITGLEQLNNALSSIDVDNLASPVFIECLACDGGCLGGPGMDKGRAGLDSLLDVMSVARVGDACKGRLKRVAVLQKYEPYINVEGCCTEKAIQAAMWQIGKESAADELNCGGCGYDTCREFAKALVHNRAEAQMCVSYMRRLAQKKANALLRSMPSGVVIVNDEMEIIECNEAFARLFGEDTEVAYRAYPGLNGARLENIVAFGELFRAALRSGEDISRDHLECGNRLFKLTIFTIEAGKTVGAVIQDVTNQEIKREQIARRAREVIQKNIATVQEIACLLGEHVTDTEILLSSIADDYAQNKPGDVE